MEAVSKSSGLRRSKRDAPLRIAVSVAILLTFKNINIANPNRGQVVNVREED